MDWSNMSRESDSPALLIEPHIRMPTFFKTKTQSKRPDSALEGKLNRLNRLDRYLKVLKYNNDAWLRKRGKSSFTGFTPAQRQEIRSFFDALDTDSSGGVTIEELFEPLLALGLAQTKEDVKTLFRNSGKGEVIDFEEFVGILEREKITESAFKQMLEVFMRPSPLPHKLRISSQRRKLMLQAYTGRSALKRENGQSVIKAYAEEINTTRPAVEKSEALVQKRLKRLATLRSDSRTSSFYARAPSAAYSSRRSPGRGLARQRDTSSNLSGFL